jgi:hypothetical protein
MSGAITFHLPVCLHGLNLDNLIFNFTISVVKDMRPLPIHAGVAVCSSTHITLRTKTSLRTLREVSASGATHISKAVCVDGQIMKVVPLI